MRNFIVLLLLINISLVKGQFKPSGTMLSSGNANIKLVKEHFLVESRNIRLPIELTFQSCLLIGINREVDDWYVLPLNEINGKIKVNASLWVIPKNPFSTSDTWFIKLQSNDSITATYNNVAKVLIYSDKFEMYKSEARPHSDCFNNRYSINIKGGDTLENTLANFYWGTMLPSVVEKTLAKNFTYSKGYVLSTLNIKAYAGSYPDVDHEFQIKGRLAMASDLDKNIVRRMIELQFKLMQDDPEKLFRNPCSVQPAGWREYHIRRNSKNNTENADMFLLTGNIEVLEESWKYFLATKDTNWLNKNIVNLENAASLTIANTDQYGRVWSDVFYEDQVMKDGRETMSGALAAYTFNLLSKIEALLKREDKANYYSGISEKIAAMLVKPVQPGYWDEKNRRFVDWVDRNGNIHDHIHLLANILPMIFGYASSEQTRSVLQMVDSNIKSFQRFPSFVAVDIAGYTDSEIGDGGPYDLCATGRYWYWDAAFWEWRNNNDMIFNQLKSVAIQAVKDEYLMGERYDMDYVYYIDGKNWHGAEKYYEYPCVYTSVLINSFLGINNTIDADLSIKPHINSYGSVEFNIQGYNIKYTYDKNGFKLKNLANISRNFKVDLSGLYNDKAQFKYVRKSKKEISGSNIIIKLSPHEEVNWVPIK